MWFYHTQLNFNVGTNNLTVLTNLNLYIPILKVEFLRTFNRSERWRKLDYSVVVRTGVHAEPVQLVVASQPPWNRHRRRRRRRRTPSDAAHEPDPDKPAARSHTYCLHEWSDESHFGCLLPAPTDSSAVLHVVLISPPDVIQLAPTNFHRFLLSGRKFRLLTTRHVYLAKSCGVLNVFHSNIDRYVHKFKQKKNLFSVSSLGRCGKVHYTAKCVIVVGSYKCVHTHTNYRRNPTRTTGLFWERAHLKYIIAIPILIIII